MLVLVAGIRRPNFRRKLRTSGHPRRRVDFPESFGFLAFDDDPRRREQRHRGNIDVGNAEGAAGQASDELAMLRRKQLTSLGHFGHTKPAGTVRLAAAGRSPTARVMTQPIGRRNERGAPRRARPCRS